MLWSDIKYLRYLAVITGALALSGCGFRPLYNQPAASGETQNYNVQRDLATIAILPIRDRIGQQLHNHLLTRFNPKGRPADPVYELQVTLTEAVQELGIQKTSLATRANLRIAANYTLSFSSGEKPDKANKLPSGQVLAISSYDISTFEFTTLTARKDARTRAVREIADDLRTRFAVYFAQRRK